MPRYIKYPVLTFFAAAVVYFTASLVQAFTASEVETAPAPKGVLQAYDHPEPNYLITDGSVRPQ